MKTHQADLLADDTHLHALIDRIDTVDEETFTASVATIARRVGGYHG